MKEILSLITIGVGMIFMFLAGVGILRMPDLYQRMSATTKVATMGVGSMLFAAAVHFDDLGITVRAMATVAFILLTAPVSAHVLGRVAYISGVPMWEGSITDELKGRYDLETHELSSFTIHAPESDTEEPNSGKSGDG